MSRLSAARRVALSLVGQCRRRDARARELLRSSSQVAALEPRERAFVTRLVCGTIAARGMLDSIIDERVKRPSSLEPAVRDALRIAAFECAYLNTAPRAAVSQGVELVRSVTPRAVGLANAVLRRIAEELPSHIAQARTRAEAGEADIHELVLVSGLPEWLLTQIAASWGQPELCDFALAQLEPAPVWVSANRARHTDEELFALLEEAGLAPRKDEPSGCYLLEKPANLARSGLVDTVGLAVADQSAHKIVALAAPRPGSQILEIGQGRGTKTLLLESAAICAGGPAQIVAVDSEPFKVELSQKRMQRAGLESWVSCHVYDGRALASAQAPDYLAGSFDLVFLDAPCSGTGTMRRHPEIAWSLDEASIHMLAKLQSELLTAAATRVRPGGRLCYATCSLLKEENENVVRGFLASEQGAAFTWDYESGRFQSIPKLNAADGHFCAILHKA